VAGDASVELVQGEGGTEKRDGEPVEAARRWIDAGAESLHLVDRVILGTAAVEDPDIVTEISEDHPDGVVASLDAKDGEAVVEGWTEVPGSAPWTPQGGTRTSGPPRSSLRTSTSRDGSRRGSVRADGNGRSSAYRTTTTGTEDRRNTFSATLPTKTRSETDPL